ncbi:MAG TPA: hypothetical protein PLH19_01690 [Anaerolineae bacterium]|nr:hypothetical protein [Anaerolineae bacterium]HQH37236.1 hypothetical protein [Anaerolineae bacterium]
MSENTVDGAQTAAETQFKQTLLEMALLTEIKDPTLYPVTIFTQCVLPGRK